MFFQIPGLVTRVFREVNLFAKKVPSSANSALVLKISAINIKVRKINNGPKYNRLYLPVFIILEMYNFGPFRKNAGVLLERRQS